MQLPCSLHTHAHRIFPCCFPGERLRNVHVPAPADHQATGIPTANPLNRWKKIIQEQDVRVDVAEPFESSAFLRLGEDTADKRCAELVSHKIGHMRRTGLCRSLGDAFLVAKKQYLTGRLQPGPTGDRIPLNRRKMAAKRLCN